MVDTRVRARATAAAERMREMGVVCPGPPALRGQLATWLEQQVAVDALFFAAERLFAAALDQRAAGDAALAEESDGLAVWLLTEAETWPT